MAGLNPLPAARFPSRIFSAGAPLSYEAAVEATDVLGRLPTEIFGSTETGAIATREQANNNEPWRLLPGIAMRPSDDGCLSLRSPWVSEDWFETSKRISLPEIEQTLRHLPWITAVATTLLPGSPARLAAAVVLSGEGRERLAALGSFRLGRLLRKTLAPTQEAAGMPRLWRFVDDLPAQDGMGKRRDDDIRALFGPAP
jgi:acyl-coenzyme A synthetase/AMP-(fatty) acid ligase